MEERKQQWAVGSGTLVVITDRTGGTYVPGKEKKPRVRVLLGGGRWRLRK